MRVCGIQTKKRELSKNKSIKKWLFFGKAGNNDSVLAEAGFEPATLRA